MGDGFARYAEERERYLRSIVRVLEEDDRIVALWLGGSFGRDDADNLSDLDLFIVVAREHAETLCRRDFAIGAGTTPERLGIFSRVAKPAIIHENHHNAPAGGTFTAVVYADSDQQVDWTFLTASTACRPLQSRLLFEKEPVPECPPVPAPDEHNRKHQIAERHAFFWMIAIPTIKYALRGDGVHFHILLDMLDRTARDIERLLDREPWTYQRGSRVTLHTTESEQLRAADSLCKRVRELEPQILAAGISIPENAAVTIQRLMSDAHSE